MSQTLKKHLFVLLDAFGAWGVLMLVYQKGGGGHLAPGMFVCFVWYVFLRNFVRCDAERALWCVWIWRNLKLNSS